MYPVGDLLGLLAHFAHLAADESLDGEEGVLRVHNSLALGNLQKARPLSNSGLPCLVIPVYDIKPTPPLLYTALPPEHGKTSSRAKRHLDSSALFSLLHYFQALSNAPYALLSPFPTVHPHPSPAYPLTFLSVTTLSVKGRHLHCQQRIFTCPTSLSPVFVNATTEGVVRAPSALVTIVGLPPSMAATAEFVVPKSTPTTYKCIT